MRTPTVSRLSTSNSSHAPRPGITLTECSVFSVVSLTFTKKYTPGERTSWDTTTRSVPLMMKVPFSVIIGKSPMKTVWLLISPVLLLMNSAVTNSGAAYVMSLSLHSSTGALTSSKRGSVNDSDIEPEKSSIGESSVSTSSRPPTGFTSPRALAFSRHSSAPTSHWNDSVCTSRSPGTSSGSRSFANEIRLGAPGTELLVVATADLLGRDPAKMHPSSTSCDYAEAEAAGPFCRYICVGSAGVSRSQASRTHGTRLDH